MCGIVGYIGENAVSHSFENLKKLEYRGYDSAGIACIIDQKIYCVKSKGYIENAEKKAKSLSNSSSIAIAHTRWATTGKVSEKNAHPHISESSRFAVVHNGIIENYQTLKADISNTGYRFKSQTDTEVICGLLDIESQTEKSIMKILKTVTKKLEGSYAVLILDKLNPHNLYLIKKDMPLFVAIEKNFSAVASSTMGLPKQSTTYTMLENSDIACLSKTSLKIFNNDNLTSRQKFNMKSSDRILSDIQHKHYMFKEILEIEEKLNNTRSHFYDEHNGYLHMINSVFFNKKRIHLVACGTAYHACLYGAKLLMNCGYDASAHIASEFKYNPPILTNDALFIFVSQSGETADTLGSLKLVQDLGLDCLCITNVESSTMSHIEKNHILTKADDEIAVASTKSYVCQCLVFYLICEHLNEKMSKININDLNFDKIFQNLKPIQTLAKEVNKFKKVFFIGRNIDYITAMEGCLKLKEISYIMAESYPAGELKHGSLALIDSSALAIIILTNKEMLSKIQNTISEIKSRGGKVLLISPFVEYFDSEEIDLYYKLEEINNNFAYAIASVVPLQLLSYFSCTYLNLNPDKPRNLAKSVTVE